MTTVAQKPRPRRPRIFVGIASYRDPECQCTVKDLFEKAAHPERVAVGIVWQRDPQQDHRCFVIPSPRPKQTRVLQIDAKASKGVCWARAQLPSLWQGEEYLFQIDSHMRFEPNWDELLMLMYRMCLTRNAVLTTYPAGYTPPRHIPNHVTHRLVAKRFDQNEILTMASRAIPTDQAQNPPLLGAFVGACMLFGPSTIMRDVPYDPHLYFFGEEISFAARLWTHGYDIYHPTRPVVYHQWERNTRPTHFDDHPDWPKQNAVSFARVRHLLGTQVSKDKQVLTEIAKYGLGRRRGLRQYEEFCGVDFSRRRITRAALEGRFPVNRDLSVRFANAGRPSSGGKPAKVLEAPEVVVYDNFLPSDAYERLVASAEQLDYRHINTQGAVNRVWDLGNGFPLRSDKTVYYYAPGSSPSKSHTVYPTSTPFDQLVESVNQAVPQVSHLVGSAGKDWSHYSVSAWLYPQNTGLSMHEDGSGVYSGAYAFFLNRTWRPHWGGHLIVLDRAGNEAIAHYKGQVDRVRAYKQKWLHTSAHDQIATEAGLGYCIFPKANRMVFIAPRAYHMVSQVTPAAGDNPRMSLAGFFHSAGPRSRATSRRA